MRSGPSSTSWSSRTNRVDAHTSRSIEDHAVAQQPHSVAGVADVLPVRVALDAPRFLRQSALFVEQGHITPAGEGGEKDSGVQKAPPGAPESTQLGRHRRDKAPPEVVTSSGA